MARAFPQSQSSDYDRDPGEWQSLRHELVGLLDQLDSQVSRGRGESNMSERARDMRVEAAGADPDRHRDALRSVQRQISRFEDPAMPLSARDSIESAISQIRSRQGARPAPQPALQPAPVPVARDDSAVLEKLAQSVTGLSGRLERLEGEIRSQLKSGANVKDVADQVSQLAHVVELLAGAVGETGQVKRLEGQIASLGRIISQGREIDVSSLTRRLDDVAGTIGKLAELQVHYVDKVENPVASQAFKDGMLAIEENVRSVYDRIDSLERNSSLTPRDLEHVTAEMARFTEAVREHSGAPQGLVELIDALNLRIAEIETGDRLVLGLRKDLTSLRDSVVTSLAPRFDAIEHRMDGLSTREDMAEIGRQIGLLGDRIGSQPGEVTFGHLEAQVRHLVARMDQTGEQLSGLARLYTEPVAAPVPDFDAMADMVAERAAAAIEQSSTASLTQTIGGLESRITAMLQAMPRDPEINDFGGMQAGIGEVNERLKRLEESLTARANQAEDMSRAASIGSMVATSDRTMPTPRDLMARSPVDDVPLIDPPFDEPSGPVQQALDSRMPMRQRHPGLDDSSLASRHDEAPEPVQHFDYVADKVEAPAAPRPSMDFSAHETDESAPVSYASTNTFIAAARRAASRQPQGSKSAAGSNSLIGRALSRFQVNGETAAMAAPAAAPPKGKRKEFKPEPAMVAPVPSIEPSMMDAAAPPPATESFLSRNRKTILLAATVVAIAFLTINLVAQRLGHPSETTEVSPTTTGDIAPMLDPGTADRLAASIPPRVISTDSMPTGSIDHAISPAFTTSPIPAMPSAFSPPSDAAVPSDAPVPIVDATSTDTSESSVAAIDPSAALVPAAPVAAEAGATRFDLPPESVGPIELRQAAASGDEHADFEVAAIYTEGRAVKQDYAAAAIWYGRAADQGFAPAEYRLGSLYENGNGVTKNLDTARGWYEKAAEAGNRMSMHNLASLYAGGQLGTQQFDSAAKWFQQAADRGLTDSQFNLGMLYARGLGVKQSLADSFKWFSIAALSGDKDSAKARDDIARSLDAATVAKLTDEVKAFKAQPIDLAANFAPIGTWTNKFNPGETIGSHDIVLSVQKALVKLGYDVGSPDGVAGKKTADAIKSFEGATGMTELGLVNPRLLAVLGSQPV